MRDVPARPELLLPALEAALSSTGPAVSPGPVDATEVPDGVAVVVRTSGSTGDPARRAARRRRPCARRPPPPRPGSPAPGAGCWRCPCTTSPGSRCSSARCWRARRRWRWPRDRSARAAFVAAAAAMAGTGPRYTSLVPTQLVRLLDDPAATTALTSFDAVLLGGAATAPDLLDRARGRGRPRGHHVRHVGDLRRLRVRRRPARRRVRPAGRRRTRSCWPAPCWPTGYLGRPDLDADAFVQVDGVRHLRTTDLGAWTGGTLTVLGRADDVLVTGGVKVPPGPVESVLAGLPGVGEVCVVGIPDDGVGSARRRRRRPAARRRPPSLADARAAVTDQPRRHPRAPRTSWSRTRSRCAGRARSTVGPPRCSPPRHLERNSP